MRDITREERIRREQIRIVFRYAPLSLAGSSALCLATVAVLYPDVSVFGLWVWAGLVLALTACRTGHYLLHRASVRDQLDHPGVEKLGPHTVWFSALLGLLWAWLPAYYVQPDQLLTLTSVSLFLVGAIAGALVTQSVYLPSLLGFALPIMISSFLAVLINGGSYSYLAGIGIVYSAIAILFSVSINKMFRESIETRFDNLDLVAQLRAEKLEAEEANRAKSQFLAAASHDLRQPLHTISLYAGMLKEEPGSREVVDRLGAALRSMEALYDRILEISKLDAGVVEPELASVPLHNLMSSLESRYRPLAEEKGLSLTVECDDCWVRSDRVLLERVLDNLLSNALRYTPQGSVKVVTRQQGKGVELEVADTGVGIAADEQPLIFREFYQIDNPERDRSKGLGLGLSIVLRLAGLLQHQLSLDSEPGNGTSFRLSLAGAEPERLDDQGATVMASLDGVRVLVIEDELEVQRATVALLEQWGCEVSALESGRAATELVEMPDLVIADYRLRDGETGVDAVRSVNDRFASAVPALILTGDTAPERIREAARSDYPVLHKPVSAGELRVAVNRLVIAVG